MKKVILFCGVIILTLINSNYGISQIYEPDGLRMPGDWNSWTNDHGMGGDFDFQKISTGTDRWQTTFQYTGTTGVQEFKFVSGGSENTWHNQWAGNTSVSLDNFENFTYGTPSDPNNSISVTQNKWYTVNWEDNGYANTSAIFMETSSEPVTFTSVEFEPENPMPDEEVEVTVATSDEPCDEEIIYVRYTTDNWVSSSLVEVDFNNDIGKATIIGQDGGTNLEFYIFSTTVSNPSHANADMVTIRFENNDGDNYSYSVIDAIVSTQSGNWSTTSIWEGGSVPPVEASVIIKNGHTVTLNQNATVTNIIIESGATLTFQDANSRELTIAAGGKFTNNGTLNHNDGVLILKGGTITEGTSASQFNDVVIDGIDINMMFNSSKINGTLEILSGNIENNAPELKEGSTLKYSQGGSFDRQTEWNNPWHVIITNSTELLLNAGAWTGDFHPIGGNLTIETGSTFNFQDSDKGIKVLGDVNLDGTLELSSVVGGDIEVEGNWNRTGTFTPNNRAVFFNAISGTQELNGHTTFDYLYIENSGSEFILNDGITVAEEISVANGATLNMGTQLIDGAGNFELVAGGTLKIGSPNGIASSGAIGNIQNTGSRTFANAATYHYIYNGAEGTVYSGNALPNTGAAKNIIIELGSNDIDFIVDTNNNIIINSPGKLEIISGTLVEPENEADGQYIYGTDGLLEMNGGNYVIASISDTEYKPRLSGVYNLTGGTIIFSGNGNQLLRGTRDYNNLTFSSNTITKLSSAISNVSGTVLIEDNAIVDAENRTFGSVATNLTMTGGRLILAGARTLPDMEETFDLTGGTIEFAGSSSNHQIRGGKDYFNIEISGSEVSTSGGNFTIKENATFTIKSGASFEFASGRSVSGEGSFVLEEGGTLLYGNAHGITGSGTGTDGGNIRVSGDRIFPSNATYGLIGGVNMVTGNGLPATVQNLIVNKTGTTTATLSQALEVTGNLTLTNRNINTGTHTLSLSNNEADALIGGSEDAYIVGTLARGIKTNSKSSKDANIYLFPIGAPDSYNPAVITFSTLPDPAGTLTASFKTTLPSAEEYYGGLPIFDGDQKIDNVSDKGFWELSANNMENFVFNMAIRGSNFTEGATYNIADPDGLRLLIRDDFASDWELIGDHQPDSGNDNPPEVARNDLDKFGVIAMGGLYADNPLPIELLSFSATKLNDNIKILWSTATETNNDFFTLMKSTDGHNFAPIAIIPGAGNSNSIINYSWIDKKPMPGINYYQLKQTDFDGSYSLSNIVALNLLFESDHYIFYNNNKILITLSWTENQVVDYTLFSFNGKLLSQGNFEHFPGKTAIINTNQLTSGIVILTLTGNWKIISEKLIINNN